MEEVRGLLWPFVESFLDRAEFDALEVDEVMEMLSPEQQMAVVEKMQRESPNMEAFMNNYMTFFVNLPNRTLARMCQLNKTMQKNCLQIARYVANARHGAGAWQRFMESLEDDSIAMRIPMLGLAVMEVGEALKVPQLRKAYMVLSHNVSKEFGSEGRRAEDVLTLELASKAQQIGGISFYLRVAANILHESQELDQYTLNWTPLPGFIPRLQYLLLRLLTGSGLHVSKFYVDTSTGRTDQHHLISTRFNVCSICQAKAKFTCGKCARQRYCGVECQKKAWIQHKKEDCVQ